MAQFARLWYWASSTCPPSASTTRTRSSTIAWRPTGRARSQTPAPSQVARITTHVAASAAQPMAVAARMAGRGRNRTPTRRASSPLAGRLLVRVIQWERRDRAPECNTAAIRRLFPVFRFK